MTGLLTEEHRAYIGVEEPPRRVEVNRRDIMKYAAATEQQQEKYLRGDEAPLMFIFNLFGSVTSTIIVAEQFGYAASCHTHGPLRACVHHEAFERSDQKVLALQSVCGSRKNELTTFIHTSP